MHLQQKATELGFPLIGWTNLNIPSHHADQSAKWIARGLAAGMQPWMIRQQNKRADIRNWWSEAKSIIVLGMPYFQHENRGDGWQISRYALGDDYHLTIPPKVEKLRTFLQEIHPIAQGRIAVDSSPILERAFAEKAGLGWIGKNTMLINKKYGSYFFLAELVLNIEAPSAEEQIKNACANCRKCIDACPTNALNAYELDSRKCIAYWSIEHRGEIPKDLSEKFADWLFGCDICQEVCPFNVKIPESPEPAFEMRSEFGEKNLEDWANIPLKEFSKLFSNSPVKRTKFDGFKRNVEILIENRKSINLEKK